MFIIIIFIPIFILILCIPFIVNVIPDDLYYNGHKYKFININDFLNDNLIKYNYSIKFKPLIIRYKEGLYGKEPILKARYTIEGKTFGSQLINIGIYNNESDAKKDLIRIYNRKLEILNNEYSKNNLLTKFNTK